MIKTVILSSNRLTCVVVDKNAPVGKGLKRGRAEGAGVEYFSNHYILTTEGRGKDTPDLFSMPPSILLYPTFILH